FSLRLTPVAEGIAIHTEVENTTGRTLYDVAMSFCVVFYEAPEFIDTGLKRTFISISRGLVPLADTDRRRDWQRAIYWVRGRARCTYGFRAIPPSTDEATEGCILIRSENGSHILGVGFDNANVLFIDAFQNRCAHADPFFGSIPPGERRSARGEILLF